MKKLAIIGGGPASLMVYQRLLQYKLIDFEVSIFEATDTLGSGMPYSSQGAAPEHVTNVSGDELPDLPVSLTDWVKDLPSATLIDFDLDPEKFHQKKVLPRLLFGQYLKSQFELLLQMGESLGLKTTVHYRTRVLDIKGGVPVLVTDTLGDLAFDAVVICSGHHWPSDKEQNLTGYFDSPYPPAKIARKFNHTVGVRGSSLTAVDAIRTMMRHNGQISSVDGRLQWQADSSSPDFKVEMHSRHGLLPSVRVHMEEPHGAQNTLLSDAQIASNRQSNGGFLSLDYVFETAFKEPLAESDPKLYQIIKSLTLEDFVETMLQFRENTEPFELLKKEYLEALHSIAEERPVYWKELLAGLSFTLNYPAKYLSAEDMLRLQKTLMPLISVVIAFLPQSSCEELMALHQAGALSLVSDGADGSIEISDNGAILYHFEQDGNKVTSSYETFVDCVGQPHLTVEQFPFKSLLVDGTVSGAHLQFQSASRAKELQADGVEHIYQVGDKYYLAVPGADITDNFELVSKDGCVSKSIYLMAVPYMGGLNPDYSGLDFCERASDLVVKKLAG